MPAASIRSFNLTYTESNGSTLNLVLSPDPATPTKSTVIDLMVRWLSMAGGLFMLAFAIVNLFPICISIYQERKCLKIGRARDKERREESKKEFKATPEATPQATPEGTPSNTACDTTSGETNWIGINSTAAICTTASSPTESCSLQSPDPVRLSDSEENVHNMAYRLSYETGRSAASTAAAVMGSIASIDSTQNEMRR